VPHCWRRSVRLAALAAVGAGCLTVSACGLTNSGGSGGASASASASVNPDPLASVSADTIATQAIANLKAASNLTMGGTLSVIGQPYTLDLGIKSGKGCAGSIDEGSKGSVKLIVIGQTVYVKPDDKWWQAIAGSSAVATNISELTNGRYVKTTPTSKVGALSALCNLSEVLAQSFNIDGTLAKGKLTTLDGAKVLPITDGSGGTAWVTDAAKPELVAVKSPKKASGDGGDLTFSTSAPVTLTPPPASDVIDGSKLLF
jgi:hypothetical protein